MFNSGGNVSLPLAKIREISSWTDQGLYYTIKAFESQIRHDQNEVDEWCNRIGKISHQGKNASMKDTTRDSLTTYIPDRYSHVCMLRSRLMSGRTRDALPRLSVKYDH